MGQDMSTEAVHKKVREARPLFAPQVVRLDSILSAMLAPRVDHYGEHVKHFVRYAEEHGGEVDYDLVRDYFRDLNSALCAANTKRIRRQAVKVRLQAAMRDSMSAGPF